MTEANTKHPNYNNELLPVSEDIFKPEFKRDSRGRYFMQLPGYGKWMVSVEPGSKIVAQGSEDESGYPATDPGSIRTGSLHAETVISIGDNIYLDGGTGCIYVGDYQKRVGPSMSICGGGMRGYSGSDAVFAFFLEEDGDFGVGDVFIGDYASNEYILWDDSEGKLYVKGTIIITGDIISSNYVYNVSGYKLEYLTGNAYFNAVFIHGGTIDQSLITNLAAGSEPSIQGWSHSMVFTATDWDTLSWTSGTIYLTDGTTYSINSGSLDMSTGDVYYIYYSGSSTLSTTIAAVNAVGSGKILICVCKRNPVSDTGKLAVFQVFGNDGQGIFIIADDIASNTITANEIFANTITANEIASHTITANEVLANTLTANEIYSLVFTGKTADFDTGTIAGWVMSSECLTKDKDIGATGITRLQLCIGAGTGRGHIQAVYNHDRITYPGFPHPNAPIDLIQMTQGDVSDPGGVPSPRLDIYRKEGTQSKKRVMLDSDGLHFYDASENLVGTITGNDAGTYTTFDIADMRVASDTVRIFSNGIRIAYPQPLNIADSSGKYLQFYCGHDTFTGSVIGKISLSYNNYLRFEADDHSPGSRGAIAYFSGVYGGPWALNLFGNLALYTNNLDQGNTIGALYFNTSSNELRLRNNSAWVTVGGAGMPSGGSYDMLRCVSGTTWVSTADVYWGGLSSYHIYRDPSSGDTYFIIPNNKDYAFKRGPSFYAVIDDNFWTAGNLYANGGCQVGGTISNSAGDIICYAGNLQLLRTGAIVAVKDSGGTTRYLTCKWNATVSKYILST